ncbi:hypothetical protein Tco_1282594 [Tanacetum coccineum]
MVKGKKEQSRSLALKVKKEVSDEDNSSSDKKRSKEVEVMVMVKVKENILDAVIQITSLENVQSRQRTTIKEHLSGRAWSYNENMKEKTKKNETCLESRATIVKYA